MSEAAPPPLPELREAPRVRQALAWLIDVSFVAGVAFARRRAAGRSLFHAEPAQRSPARSAVEVLMWPMAVVQHVGSPGERLAGVRTVDRRTHRPVTLSRALVLTVATAGLRALRTGLTPPAITEEDRLRHQEMSRRVPEIQRLHPDDREARQAAMTELFREYGPARNTLGPMLAVTLATSLLERQLQRRIAPTVAVLDRDLR
jgi:hypothetical protein